MEGYWRDAGATTEAILDGRLRTGDVGMLDADGQVSVVHRKKDVIITGGENVYGAEVEKVLSTHPGVADVAVIGLPDEVWGENVCAVVVPRPGTTVTGDDLIEHCRANLASYKKPKTVRFVEALPRNPAGKVLKRDLRERCSG